MEPAAKEGASGFSPGLLSFEFFFRCKFLILSDSDRLCPCEKAMSEP